MKINFSAKDLEKKIKNQVNQKLKDGIENTCPKCGQKIILKTGENICPNCKTKIEFKGKV